MKKLFILIILCIGTLSYAQNKVSGVVKDAQSGETLIGANILIEGTVSGTITDLDGNFDLNVSKDLPFNLIFSLVGYASQTITITEPNQVLDLVMDTESVIADEIVVSASRVEESILQSPVTIEKLDLLALQQTTSADYYDEITKLKGVHHTQASVTFSSVNARGFAAHGNTRFVQLQDGIDNAAPLLNFPTGSIVGIPDLDIKNVELIPGASSALYGPNAFNGILLMTSKDPFNYQGLSAQVKTGITDGRSVDPLFGASVRYAKAFNDKFAFKINLSALQAQDWQADDYTSQRSPDILGDLSPGDPAFDGINLYGDEVLIGGVLTGLPFAIKRTGWKEGDILDNRNAESYKANAALHYRITDNLEANVSYQWGSGSSVYQGSERYALRDLVQTFTKLELNSDKWNIRAYRSQTDAGRSYNMTALGAFGSEALFPSVNTVTLSTGAEVTAGWVPSFVAAYGGSFESLLGPSFTGNTDLAREFADNGGLASLNPSIQQLFIGNLLAGGMSMADAQLVLGGFSGQARFENGQNSAAGLAAVDQVRTGLFQQGGASFIDDSYMDHVEGQYDLSSLVSDALGLQVGGNYRKLSLFTDGTVFNEDPEGTGTNERIEIGEFGLYLQASKSILDDRLKIKGSLRYDKNENFDGQVSPRLAFVYSAGEKKNHNLRASYQTGFRNPTTQGQYIYFPTSNILLGGTRQNAERYGIYEGGAWSEASWVEFLGSGDPADLKTQYLDYVTPEKLQTFEIGYKGISNRKLFLDVSAYYNIYNDFITQNNVVSKEATSHRGNIIDAGTTFRPYFNAPVEITSYGFSTSAEYLLGNSKNWRLAGNYTFNDFALPDALPEGFEQYDPSFNTPTSKINVGITNRKLWKTMSAGVNFRWQNEHYFSSSFGEGTMPAFATLDAQVGYKLTDYKSTVKLGVSNILKNEYRTNYGGPFIGRMIHLTLTYDQFAN